MISALIANDMAVTAPSSLESHVIENKLAKKRIALLELG